MAILEKLERGEIDPQEAERLLTQAPTPAKPAEAPTRMGILEKVERGELSADQAAGMIVMDAVVEKTKFVHHGKHRLSDDAEEDVTFTPASDTAGIWKGFLGAGLVITIATAALMAFIQQRSGMNFWFYCAWLPLAAGIALTALAWSARNSTWLQMQVRSRKDNGHKVFFTLPLPVSMIQNFLARRGSGRVTVTQAKPTGKFHLDL
jgi:hypothetical protein